ncbi:hypothetical protein N0V88_000387 [Collariella sp. IMI 366227]|nr:hypothetical protein N0V88_000387 [Collariella sp. IMI 366227]
MEEERTITLDLGSSPDPLIDPILSPPMVPMSHIKTKSPAAQRLYTVLAPSPRKQTFDLDIGNERSPQRLRVTVEADHDATTRNTSRRLFQSPTPKRRAAQRRDTIVTTTTVPLRGMSDDEGAGTTPKRKGRPRKSGTPVTTRRKRPGTPAKGRKSVAHVLDSPEKNILTSDIGLGTTSRPTPQPRRGAKRKSMSPVKGDGAPGSQPRKRGWPRKQTITADDIARFEQEATADHGAWNNAPARGEILPATSQPADEMEDDIWLMAMSDQATPIARTQQENHASEPPNEHVPLEFEAPRAEPENQHQYDWPDIGGGGGDSYSEAESLASENGDHYDGDDTIMAGEEFTMISIGSLPSMQPNSSVMAPGTRDEFGDATGAIVNGALEYLRQSHNKRAEETVNAEPVTAMQGQSLAPEHAEHPPTTKNVEHHETGAYDDSFSEIPEAVLLAATPRRYRQPQTQEEEPASEDIQPSIERSSTPYTNQSPPQQQQQQQRSWFAKPFENVREFIVQAISPSRQRRQRRVEVLEGGEMEDPFGPDPEEVGRPGSRAARNTLFSGGGLGAGERLRDQQQVFQMEDGDFGPQVEMMQQGEVYEEEQEEEEQEEEEQEEEEQEEKSAAQEAEEEEEEEEDIWALEALRPTPYAKNVGPSRREPVVEPPRSRVSQPWRRNGVYSDEVSDNDASSEREANREEEELNMLARKSQVERVPVRFDRNESRLEDDEYSMLSQLREKRAPPPTKPPAPKRPDLSTFFSSPATIPDIQEAPGFGLSRALNSQRPAQRTATPESPEQDAELPHIPEKLNFTPRRREPSNSLFQPKPLAPVNALSGNSAVSAFFSARPGTHRPTRQRQAQNYEEEESSFIPSPLKPLPNRAMSPAKSSFRSPLKPKTPGRLVEFTSSTLSPLAQAQARAERRASMSPEKGRGSNRSQRVGGGSSSSGRGGGKVKVAQEDKENQSSDSPDPELEPPRFKIRDEREEQQQQQEQDHHPPTLRNELLQARKQNLAQLQREATRYHHIITTNITNKNKTANKTFVICSGR